MAVVCRRGNNQYVVFNTETAIDWPQNFIFAAPTEQWQVGPQNEHCRTVSMTMAGLSEVGVQWACQYFRYLSRPFEQVPGPAKLQWRTWRGHDIVVLPSVFDAIWSVEHLPWFHAPEVLVTSR